MAQNPRYNFTIHCKARAGRLISAPFFTGRFATDAQALAVKTALDTLYLENNAKVSVSKVIADVAQTDYELGVADVTKDFRQFKILLGNASDTNKKVNLVVPGIKLGVAADTFVDFLALAGMTDAEDPPNVMNTVISFTPSRVNIASES